MLHLRTVTVVTVVAKTIQCDEKKKVQYKMLIHPLVYLLLRFLYQETMANVIFLIVTVSFSLPVGVCVLLVVERTVNEWMNERSEKRIQIAFSEKGTSQTTIVWDVLETMIFNESNKCKQNNTTMHNMKKWVAHNKTIPTNTVKNVKNVNAPGCWQCTKVCPEYI